MTDTERPTPPRAEADLDFEPKPMVKWLDPRELLKAGQEVLLSGLFARFADKRETEAGLSAAIPRERPWHGRFRRDVASYAAPDYRDDGSLWLDYVSDVGEGFSPTYSVAWMLAQQQLQIRGPQEPVSTKRGRVLVLGGDQVYPSAGWDAYRDRFVGPYRAALPYLESSQPDLYAIPGNHDWYDGLTSFMRLFCQPSWIGAWHTRQQRSYFALRLSERWWLWGTDIQFDTYMDGPQLDYFRSASHALAANDRVILVTAKPSWVKADEEGPTPIKTQGSWQTLSFLEERIIRPTKAKVALTLSGDAHHYVRYRRCFGDGPQERITCGGGGAHTSATHGLPESITLSPETGGVQQSYVRVAPYPPIGESRRMRARGAFSVFEAPWLGVLIGVIYAVLSLLVAGALKDQSTGLAEPLLADRSWLSLLWDAASWWTIGLSALLFIGLRAFADARQGRFVGVAVKRWLFGGIHWALHVIVAVGLTLLLLWLLRDSSWADEGLLLGGAVAAGLFVVGYAYGGLVLSTYFLLTNINDGRQHATEIFGGLASTQFKSFLRLRIDPEEKLTIYPIGLRNCPEWRFPREEDDATDSWFVPVADGPQPELIEPPIVIDPDA